MASVTPWKDRLGQPITLSGYTLFITRTYHALPAPPAPPPPSTPLIIQVEGETVAEIIDTYVQVEGSEIAN